MIWDFWNATKISIRYTLELLQPLVQVLQVDGLIVRVHLWAASCSGGERSATQGWRWRRQSFRTRNDPYLHPRRTANVRPSYRRRCCCCCIILQQVAAVDYAVRGGGCKRTSRRHHGCWSTGHVAGAARRFASPTGRWGFGKAVAAEGGTCVRIISPFKKQNQKEYTERI